MKFSSLLLTLMLSRVMCKTHFADEFGTNQYMMIGQFDCLTKVELQTDETCPVTFAGPNGPETCNMNADVHLIRDVHGRVPPRLLYVKQNKDGAITLFSTAIDASHQKWTPLKWYAKNREGYAPTVGTLVTGFQKTKDSYSLFDTNARVLYVFSVSKKNIRSFHVPLELDDHLVTMRLAISDYEKRFMSHYFIAFASKYHGPIILHDKNQDRSQWTADPYTGMFFYVEKIKGVPYLFQAPMVDILSVLVEGESGTPLFTLNTTRVVVSSSGGILITRETIPTEDKRNYTVTTSMRNLNQTATTKAIHCPYTTNILPQDMFSSLLVRDWDYCMVRGINKETCDNEKRAWLMEKGIIKEESEMNTFLWMLLTIIVLSVLVVLLFIYIYWLRSTFATIEDTPRQDKWNSQYHEEASMFMSKQRSFPSAYPDPALLDVSVDRWN